MKIAFVCAEDEIPGVCYLSSYLKKNGHHVELVFEPKQFDRAYIRNAFLARLFSRNENNLNALRRLQPDIIGFSCTTAHYKWAIGFAGEVKRLLPNTPVIFGGTHPTLVPELVIKEECVDFVCVGEGEQAFLELVQWLGAGGGKDCPAQNIWYKKDGLARSSPLRNLIQDLDGLPYADRELFFGHLPRHYREYAYFFTSRGCFYNCSFCGNEQLRKIFAGLGKYIRRMSPGRAVAELKFLKERYGTRHILFEDDIFSSDNKWLNEFIPEYKKEVNLPFTCFGHPQFLSEENIRLLKEGGCALLWWGVQSASEDIRKRVFNRFEKNEEIVKAADICHRVGLKFMVDHLLNIPYDSEEAIAEAVRLYSRIRPSMINCYTLLYFPKSKIIDVAIEAGLLKDRDIDVINRGEAVVYQTGRLSSRERDFYRRFALLLSMIPLLPERIVLRLGRDKRFRLLFENLPMALIPFVKIILNFRIGRGFLPLAILRMEMFFTRRFLAGRLRRT